MRGTDFLLGGNAEEGDGSFSLHFRDPHGGDEWETSGEKTRYSKARDGSI